MFETCRRSHTSHSLGYQRVDWNNRLPNKQEGFDWGNYNQETEDWFRAKSSLGYQRPSTVLVERVCVKDGVNAKDKVLKRNTKKQDGTKCTPQSGRRSADPEKTSYVIRRMELSTEGFLEFLFSDRWGEGCLLRVLRGKLLDNLLHIFTQLEKHHDVISCTTMAYAYNQRRLLPCIKNVEDEQKDQVQIEKKVMVELDVFCPPERLVADTKSDEEKSGARDQKVKAESVASDPLGGNNDDDEGSPLHNIMDTADEGTAITQAEKLAPRSSTSVRSVEGPEANPADVADRLLPCAQTDHPAESSPPSPTITTTAAESETSDHLSDVAQTSPDAEVRSITESTQPKVSFLDRKTRISSFRIGTSAGPYVTEELAAEPQFLRKTPYPQIDLPYDENACETCNTSRKEKSSEAAYSRGWREKLSETANSSRREKVSEVYSGRREQLNEAAYSSRRVKLSVADCSNRREWLSEADTSRIGRSALSYSKRRSKSADSHRPGQDGGDSKYITQRLFSHQESSSGDLPAAVRCNIRGVTQPPPHEDCFAAYHMIREPFMKRRHRQGSGIPHTIFPPVAKKRTSFVYKWSDRWQDDAHLGPKANDSVEMVASDTRLQRYSEEDMTEEVKKYQSLFNKERLMISNNIRQSSSKKPKRGKKKTDDDDSLDEEDLKCPRNVDPIREEQLEKDHDRVVSDLMAADVSRRSKRVSIKTRLKRELRSRQQAKKAENNLELMDNTFPKAEDLKVSMDSASPRHLSLRFQPQSELLGTASKKVNRKQCGGKKSPGRRSSTKKTRIVNPYFGFPDVPLNVMRKWKKCPKFDEFYYYLKGMDEQTICSRLAQQRRCTDSPLQDMSTSSSVIYSTDKRSGDRSKKSSLEGKRGFSQERKTTSEAEDSVDDLTKLNKGDGKQINAKGTIKNEEPSEKDRIGEWCSSGQHARQEQEQRMAIQAHAVESFTALVDDEIRIDQRPGYRVCRGLKPTSRLHFRFRSPKPIVYHGRTTEELKHMAARGITPSGTHLLTDKQLDLIKEEQLIISDMDPWHISVRFAYLAGGVCDSIGVRNDLLNRRERIYQLLAEGKAILDLNKERLWSLVRKVPKDKRTDKKGKMIEIPEKTSDDPESVGAVIKDAEEGGGLPGVQEASNVQTRDNGRRILRRYSSSVKDPSTKTGRTERKTDFSQIRTSYERSVNRQYRRGTSRQELAIKHQQEGNKTPYMKEQSIAPPYKQLTVIDDATIPDTVTEKELFTIMDVGGEFDIGKLRSTYSFEKMFAHRIHSVPRYWQRIAKYQHPLTRKKTRDHSKTSKITAKKGKQSKVQSHPSNPDQPAEYVNEPSPPSPTLGKLKEFTFLQYKDHQPRAVDVERFQTAAGIAADELGEYLLMAIEMFVVRKERATIVDPLQTKVSITFTRRPEVVPGEDIPMLHISNSRQLVDAVCRTLLEE